MQKLTQTWGERFARAAKTVVARRQPRVPTVEWLGPFVRRVAPLASPTKRFARVDASAKPSVERQQPDEGELIPADVRERLRDIVGPAIEKARVHTGPAADAFARTHSADAVTVGNDILFRDGAYAPHTDEGFALLAHEGTHVAASVSDATARATAFGAAFEEDAALAAESRALGFPPRSPELARPGMTASMPLGARPVATNGAHAPTPTAKPMTAASDREVASPPTSAPFDVGELKRSIYRELLQQIRSDAERGG